MVEFRVTILDNLPLLIMLTFQVRRKNSPPTKKYSKIVTNSHSSQNICIRQEAGFCCIQYSLCSDSYSWAIDNKVDADTKIGTNCSQDYIEISGKSIWSCAYQASFIYHSFWYWTGVAGQCGNDNTFFLDKLCGETFGFVDTNEIAAQFVCGKTY